jgi:hypothetical protein
LSQLPLGLPHLSLTAILPLQSSLMPTTQQRQKTIQAQPP